MSRVWTEKDDKRLIYWGHCLNLALGGAPKGYHHVAKMDLDRTPEEAVARAEKLRLERPEWVRWLEAEAEAEED